MALDITLWDGGYGPSIDGWRRVCDEVFLELGVSFQPDVVRFPDGGTFNFSDRSRTAGVGCAVSVSSSAINRQLCHLLFELAERARLFVLVVDVPEFLRPPCLRGSDLERGSVPISDLDSSEALFRYFVPQQQRESV
jgi:hypothetical protein